MAPTARACETLIRRRLRGWQHGCLEIVLPNGHTFQIGRSPEPTVLNIHSYGLFRRLFLRGELGVGESFVAGEWDSPDLVAALSLFARNLECIEFETPFTQSIRVPDLLRHKKRRNSHAGSQRNIHAHYDLGNDFYRLFLGDTWTYSCAVFESDDMSLEEAQHAKLERACTHLNLASSDHLLDVGCGWGEMAIYAARTRGCRVTGITVSREQDRLARERVVQAGLADKISIQYCDYRDIRGSFDKVVSIEMLEAVGREYLPDYFGHVASCLRPGGRFFLQSILMPESRYEEYCRGVDWTQTYIFPGCHIPSLSAVIAHAENQGLVTERIDGIHQHYAKTLRTWRKRLESQPEALSALGMDEHFRRTWHLYLCFSEASFAVGSLRNGQMLFTKS